MSQVIFVAKQQVIVANEDEYVAIVEGELLQLTHLLQNNSIYYQNKVVSLFMSFQKYCSWLLSFY